MNLINTIINNDNLTTLICTLLGGFSFIGSILIIKCELHSKKKAIRYESRLNVRETSFANFISCISELLDSPNIVFDSNYINRLTKEYYNLKIYTPNNLDSKITKLVNECRNKCTSYQTAYLSNEWDYHTRLKGYLDDGLIENGTNMIKFQYELEESIRREINDYKNKNTFQEDYILTQLETISIEMKKLLNSLSQ